MQAFAYALAVLLITVARPAAAIDVTACGQNVPDGEVGDLVASLDCTGVGGHCVDDPDAGCTHDEDCTSSVKSSLCYTWGVRVGSRATLRLNGFSIVGGAPASPNSWPKVGVLCRGTDCTVDGGGGSIERTTQAGVWHFGRNSMREAQLLGPLVQQEHGRALCIEHLGAPGHDQGQERIEVQLGGERGRQLRYQPKTLAPRGHGHHPHCFSANSHS